jgi:hypothetical protein
MAYFDRKTLVRLEQQTKAARQLCAELISRGFARVIGRSRGAQAPFVPSWRN